MTIVLSGSGSGGHITPLLAVAKELKRIEPKAKLIYIGERGGKYHSLVTESKLFDDVYYVFSGKFRRYHDENLLTTIKDVRTILLNARDLIKISFGIVQGVLLLKKLGANVVFLKGGSVCIPVGIGAFFAKIPSITHDSDTPAGLSNRLGGRHAVIHTTALPIENYAYPKSITEQVGLPIGDNFREYSSSEVRFLKEKYGIPTKSRVLLVTGGSGGASRLNTWVLEAGKILLDKIDDLYLIFVTGAGKSLDIENPRIKVIEFSNELFHLGAMADLVVARAGATTLNEFASQKKAMIIVPNPELASGHQSKNAKVFDEQNAIILVSEDEINSSIKNLIDPLEELLLDSKKRKILGQNLFNTLPELAPSKRIAEIIIINAKK